MNQEELSKKLLSPSKNSRPVSYTHLDVYKRQGSKESLFATGVALLVAGLGVLGLKKQDN